MDEGRQYIQIEGTVVSLIYQNPENGYAVLRLDTPDGVVTAVGCMPGLNPGEALILTGAWATHHSYGEQFKAEFAERRMPTGRDAIYSYLASGAIKNVGPAKARDIVDKFGDKALEIIENEPEKLAQVRGITEKRAREVGVAFRRQVGLRRLMEFLAQYGLKPLVAMKLFKLYGDEALPAVKDNPYLMTVDEIGADFFEADAMALALGFESDCAERVESAVLFELGHNLDNGHTFLPYDKLVAATNQLIDVGYQTVADALEALCESGFVVRETVAGQDACYLALFREAEQFVAGRLMDMAADPARGEADVKKLVSSIEREYGITYAESQFKAVELAAESRVMVLTGGPGTGKTTCVRGIIALFDKLGLKTALCAPTGRAAKRMSELTGRESATIHRLLGAAIGEGDTLVFERDETNPLNADAVIMDETSMADLLLMRSLLAAMRPGARLVLVGDADQLPSVGPGNVFADIIRSGAVPAVVLTEIFRQATESGIVKNAHLINKGVLPELSVKSSDFFFLRRATPDKALETIVELCTERLPKNMGIDPAQIQVLSPTRKNVAGTENLNARLQTALNAPAAGKKEKTFGEYIFREGDKVMQIRNNYDIIWRNPDGLESGAGVFNGDIGYIKEIDLVHETVTVDYEDKLVTYLFEQLAELEPAWALTVHKSQGSEYRAVILAASQGAPQLLVRSVLYTAITRARELLIIVGDQGVLATMVHNDKRQRRYSGLRARLAERL
ncbi:exodeoxyribonuclease V alpha subunit [Sporobacter termitidis DSM 10068]|uniref:ATP-dependent RecD2 DNA helicase n=1 Tax=Sporobacter termitidis DSM 10068 TaxID=1123282 RepID=A0A1M5VM27_9FIRM|nr:ATP-dependent RecD-like DNA helicase [Sporobacter termitidis]SHH76316.1 exodeoxyribonuclease V alpha subunit [Sporobacter termitidis DSM 10068]